MPQRSSTALRRSDGGRCTGPVTSGPGFLGVAQASRRMGVVLVAAAPAALAERPPPDVREPPPVGDAERVAVLPPIDFNLEEDSFASEPISDADSDAAAPRHRGNPPFGSSAPVSLGTFWAPAVNVGGQDATLAMNAEFARVAMPIGVPAEGKPLWLAIGKSGRLELGTDAVLPDSGLPVPSQLWLVETGFMHVRPLDDGGSICGNFLFGSASDRAYAAGRDLTLMTVTFYNRPTGRGDDEWGYSVFYSPTL